MRKLFYVLLFFALFGFLTACGGGNDEAGQDTGTTDEQTIDNEEQTDDQVGDEGTADGQAADETTQQLTQVKRRLNFSKAVPLVMVQI